MKNLLIEINFLLMKIKQITVLLFFLNLNRGFSSVLSIILNPSGGFTNKVKVSSVAGFFYSNAWLGASSSIASYCGGQFIGLIGFKYVKL